LPPCLFSLFIIECNIMKLLVIFSSWHGTVQKVAKEIISLLETPADLYDIECSDPLSPEGYDCIVFGCSVHDRHIQNSIRDYITTNCPASKKIISCLFCCSILGDEETQLVLENDIPANVLSSFNLVELMGGIIYAKKLSFFERRILKQISFDESRMKTLDSIKIRKFSRHIQEQYLLMEKERDYIRKNTNRDRKTKKPISK